MIRISWKLGFGLGVLLLYVALAACNLVLGDLNQDEGWYLYAAGLVRDGQVPYRDFAFTQGPVLPYAYAWAYRWVDRWGVAGGRLLTAVFGGLAALGAAWLAGRAAPKGWRAAAGLLALALIAGNVYQSYFTTVVKTYALCSLFLVGGMIALSYTAGRVRAAAAFAAGVLLALAAGTRLSAGIALPVAGFYLLLRRRALGPWPWLMFGIGGVLALAGLAGPFLWSAPEGFRFGLFEYHSARAPGTLLQLLVFKAGFVSRTVQAYFLPLLLGLGLAGLRWITPAEKADSSRGGFPAAIWMTVALVTLVHLAAPFPYDDYQAMIFPVFAAVLSAALVRYLAEVRARRTEAAGSDDPWLAWLLVLVFVGSLAASFSSPINQDWFVLGRDRIWWRLKQDSSIRKVRDIGNWLGKKSRIGDVLLTQDTYLAVEARLPVPMGMEMGPFSYFPDMPTGRARALRVLNRELMEEQLAGAPASFAAFSGYGLAIRSPEVSPLTAEEQAGLWKLVKRRYAEFCQVPDFGQAHTTLRLFRRRPEDAP